MSTKNSKRVYSKPIVQKPKEEIIEEQAEEITEARPVDPEVFETKLFVPEEPEEFVEISGEEELVDEPEIEPAAVPTAQGVDAAAPEPEKQTELVKGDELKEKLEEIKTKIEEFQTIQVTPASPEPEPMYTLTKEQEEEV